MEAERYSEILFLARAKIKELGMEKQKGHTHIISQLNITPEEQGEFWDEAKIRNPEFFTEHMAPMPYHGNVNTTVSTDHLDTEYYQYEIIFYENEKKPLLLNMPNNGIVPRGETDPNKLLKDQFNAQLQAAKYFFAIDDWEKKRHTFINLLRVSEVKFVKKFLVTEVKKKKEEKKRRKKKK